MEKMNENKQQQAVEAKDRDWNDAIGPFYAGHRIGASMGVSNDEVSRMVAENELLELKTSDNVSLFCAWEFDHTMAPKPWLKDILTILADSDIDSWTKALWIKGAERNISAGPIDEWLAEGNSLDLFLEEARSDVKRWSN